MFTHLTNQQGIADSLKRLITESKPPRVIRQRAFDILVIFERCPWQPIALADAIAIITPGQFDVDATGRLAYTGDDPVAEIVPRVLQVYIHVIAPDELIPPPLLFSTEEAARYLKMSVANVKHHVHTRGNLAGQKVGNSLVFTADELDHFQATRRKPGRPRKEEAS